jgi:uncharacterized protein YukJ
MRLRRRIKRGEGRESGLHTEDLSRLDYWQDRSLLDIKRMRPIPYKDEEGNRVG